MNFKNLNKRRGNTCILGRNIVHKGKGQVTLSHQCRKIRDNVEHYSMRKTEVKGRKS